MGCVITLAIVADGRLTIGHVGDTRLYKIRPDGIRKLTRDHSPVGEREDAGELPEPEAMRHPRRHEVFRDVGTVLPRQGRAGVRRRHRGAARAGRRDPALLGRAQRHAAGRHDRAHRAAARGDAGARRRGAGRGRERRRRARQRHRGVRRDAALRRAPRARVRRDADADRAGVARRRRPTPVRRRSRLRAPAACAGRRAPSCRAGRRGSPPARSPA